MSVEISSETEELIRSEISSGHFRNADELITRGIQALHAAADRETPTVPSRSSKKNLAQFLRESPLPGSGLIFERNKDFPDPADL